MQTSSLIRETARVLPELVQAGDLTAERWLTGYGVARRFVAWEAEVARRRKRLQVLEGSGEWVGVRTEAMQDPPLRLLAEALETPTLARIPLWKVRRWAGRNRVPQTAGEEWAHQGLSAELDRLEDLCARQLDRRSTVVADARKDLRQGMSRIGEFYQAGRPEEAWRGLNGEVLPALCQLAFLEETAAERARAWRQYVKAQEEMLPYAAAYRFTSLRAGASKQEADAWLEEVFGRGPWGFGPGEMRRWFSPTELRQVLSGTEDLQSLDAWTAEWIRQWTEDELGRLTRLVAEFSGREREFHQAAERAAELDRVAVLHRLTLPGLEAHKDRLTRWRESFLELRDYLKARDRVNRLGDGAGSVKKLRRLRSHLRLIERYEAFMRGTAAAYDGKYALDDEG